MSKFIDKLNRLVKGETQSIGFTARQAASSPPKMQVVAVLPAEGSDSLTGHVAGADVAVLHISRLSDGAETLQKLSQAVPGVLWGAWLQGVTGDLKPLIKAGADFIVFSAAETPVTTGKNDKEISKILEVDASLNEGVIRSANDLPVDAVLVSRGKNDKMLTWQQLMHFCRLSDLLTKPVMAPVPADVTADELQALWEAGVTGVTIEISPKQPEDRLAKLRQEMDKTDFPFRRTKRADALAPHLGLTGKNIPSREDDK